MHISIYIEQDFSIFSSYSAFIILFSNELQGLHYQKYNVKFNFVIHQYTIIRIMSKYRLPRDFKSIEIFRLELSNEQMLYIGNRLPAGYSLILEPKKNIPKHIIEATRRRSSAFHSEDSNSQIQTQNKNHSQNNKKNVNSIPSASSKVTTQKLGAPKVEKNGPANSNNKWADTLNQGLKRAAKILSQLKNHKSSWPFLLPVDALALEIPEYYEIIKQPMDLQTIENKLKSQKYADFAQFNSDMMKIIENSYRFNEANQDYLKITSQFQNCYAKISSDSLQENKNVSKNQKKKKKTSVTNREYSDSVPVTLMEKKLLSQQIRRLAKQHLKGVYAIVFDHGEQQQYFDLQKLSQKKLRELQKYVRNKIIAMEERNRNNQLQKTEISNLNMYQSDESSFLTDSSSEN